MIRRCCSGPSSGVGTKCEEIRAKLHWYLDTPWMIRHCYVSVSMGVSTKARLLSQVFRHAEDAQSRSLLERRHPVQAG